jgi:DNA replication protein DnaC
MTKNNLYAQLSENFEKLGLMQMKLHLDEIDFKSQSAASSLVKAAAFPFIKELKDFDFEFQPSINQQNLMELKNLYFLEKTENVIFLGSSGVGKTHFATSIGIAASKQRFSTYFIKCNDLFM